MQQLIMSMDYHPDVTLDHAAVISRSLHAPYQFSLVWNFKVNSRPRNRNFIPKNWNHIAQDDIRKLASSKLNLSCRKYNFLSNDIDFNIHCIEKKLLRKPKVLLCRNFLALCYLNPQFSECIHPKANILFHLFLGN